MGERVRRYVHVLLCLAAVVGVGVGGRVLWGEWRTYREVTDGCADLVSVDDVRDIDHAGRDLRADEELDLDNLPSTCRIADAGDGRSGTRLLSLRVDAGPGGGQTNIVSSPGSDGSEQWRRLEVPVGGGVPGLAEPDGTTVRLACHDGTYGSTPVDTIEVTATAEYDEGTASEADRRRMASLAVTAANRAAGRLGCSDRLAPAPDRLQPIPALAPAARAKGTCGWYARLDTSTGELPDQAMGTAVDADVWRERCVLGMSTTRAQSLFDRAFADSESIGASSRPDGEPEDDWWADVQTFYGQDQPNVYFGSAGFRHEDDQPVAAGSAGSLVADGGNTTWWATSTCDGRPAVHVLRAKYVYARAAAPHFERLFKAYVADVAARRDCTDLKFPASAAYVVKGDV
jgi:hypothetical protein